MATILLRTAGMTPTKSTRQSCRRCNGYMAHEMFTDLECGSRLSTCWVHRCIQCGDMIDEVILRNRSLSNREALCVAAV